MILVVDNFDSFTYNLVQLLGKFTDRIMVRRNNEISIGDVSAMQPERILISPGPGRPESAGISVEIIRQFGEKIPVLGVCLGHQAIGYSFGADIVHAPSLMHGRTSKVYHETTGLFQNVPNPFTATRYHSLVIARNRFPADLMVTAETEDGVIMGVRHRRFPIEGVQFHPESILTEYGETIFCNWLGVQ